MDFTNQDETLAGAPAVNGSESRLDKLENAKAMLDRLVLWENSKPSIEEILGGTVDVSATLATELAEIDESVAAEMSSLRASVVADVPAASVPQPEPGDFRGYEPDDDISESVDDIVENIIPEPAYGWRTATQAEAIAEEAQEKVSVEPEVIAEPQVSVEEAAEEVPSADEDAEDDYAWGELDDFDLSSKVFDENEFDDIDESTLVFNTPYQDDHAVTVDDDAIDDIEFLEIDTADFVDADDELDDEDEFEDLDSYDDLEADRSAGDALGFGAGDRELGIFPQVEEEFDFAEEIGTDQVRSFTDAMHLDLQFDDAEDAPEPPSADVPDAYMPEEPDGGRPSWQFWKR